MAHSEQIRLRNLTDDYRLFFPLPDRYQIAQAELTLDFMNSNALIASRSQLQVQVNGVTVAQWRLAPNLPHRLETVTIPPELLVAGYNELRFLTAQHYTEKQCEAVVSPELWTEINPLASHLTLRYRLRPAPLSLARLSELFDQKLPGATIRLLFPSSDLTETELEWGGLIAQGIGLRLEYAPFRMELGQAEANTLDGPIKIAAPKDRDLILVGVRDHLAPFLSLKVLANITGPYIGLLAAPANLERFVLVISGRNVQEVRLAALAFSLWSFPLPDVSQTVVHTVQLDPPLPYQGIPILQPSHAYTFKQLGFNTVSRTGSRPPPMEAELHFPPDLFAPEDSEVVFILHLAYNAGMRRDSLLEMRINDVFERAIPLSEESGAHYRDYRISVPLRTFRPGLNRITFHPYLVPALSGECLVFSTDQLQITLYADSSIQLPAAAHYAQLPDLSLLAHTGFPYLKEGDGSGLGIQLLNHRSDTILAAWHLLAKLARLNRLPLTQAKLGFAPVTEARDLIVVGGHLSSLDGEVFRRAPVRRDDPWKVWHYPAGKILLEAQTNRWRGWLFSPPPSPAAIETRYAAIAQTGWLGSYAMGISFPHPSAPKRLVTAFVAGGDIYPAIRALTAPRLWSQMQGNLIVWQKSSKTLAWQRLGETFYVGEAGPNLRFIFHFARHPWQWIALALASIVMFAWLTHKLLRRFKQRRHPDAEEIAP